MTHLIKFMLSANYLRKVVLETQSIMIRDHLSRNSPSERQIHCKDGKISFLFQHLISNEQIDALQPLEAISMGRKYFLMSNYF